MFSCYIHVCLCCCGSESHSWPWSRPGGQLFPRSDMVFFWLLTIPCACWPLTSGLWYFLKEHPPQLQHELTTVISPNLSYTYVFNHGPSKKIRFCFVPFSSLSTAENSKKKNNFSLFKLGKWWKDKLWEIVDYYHVQHTTSSIFGFSNTTSTVIKWDWNRQASSGDDPDIRLCAI